MFLLYCPSLHQFTHCFIFYFLSIFLMNLFFAFHLCLPPLKKSLVVLSACSFHWQFHTAATLYSQWDDNVITSPQILDLFITRADLGSAQASSPQAPVLTGPLSLPLNSILSTQRDGWSHLLLWPTVLIKHSVAFSPLKTIECFGIYSTETCANMLKEPYMDRPTKMYMQTLEKYKEMQCCHNEAALSSSSQRRMCHNASPQWSFR